MIKIEVEIIINHYSFKNEVVSSEPTRHYPSSGKSRPPNAFSFGAFRDQL